VILSAIPICSYHSHPCTIFATQFFAILEDLGVVRGIWVGIESLSSGCSKVHRGGGRGGEGQASLSQWVVVTLYPLWVSSPRAAACGQQQQTAAGCRLAYEENSPVLDLDVPPCL
jgi:hypothetical protein